MGRRRTPTSCSEHAVAYINTDGNGRGFLGIERLALAREASSTAWRRTSRIPRRTSASGSARRPRRSPTATPTSARKRASAPTCASARSARAPTTRRSCSTPASPSLNLGFGGEDDGGIYHSIYDDFYWYTHFRDTTFVYGRALAQTVGTAVIRLADADVLPFEFTDLADTVAAYAKELQTLLKQKQDEVRERNRQIDDGVFAAVGRSAAARGRAADARPCRRRSTSRRSRTPPRR